MEIFMKMNIYFIFLMIFLQIKHIEGRSEEFNECVDTEKTVNSISECTKIKIPDSEGYKCCAMKITFNEDSTYSCLALEKKYSANKEVLNEYISKIDLSVFFTSVGGKMDIDCGSELKISENYKKKSDEYLNCYNNHIKAIDNENNCTKNEIPTSEGSKCCFVQTSTKSDKGNIISDKRCYMIQDEYFTEKKNLKNYLLDESNNNLDKYSNTNITISCKNYDTFFYSGFDKKVESPEKGDNTGETGENDPTKENEKSDTSKESEKNDNSEENEKSDSEERNIILPKSSSKSGLKTWSIILIIIGCIILIGIAIFLGIKCSGGKVKKSESQSVNITEKVEIQNNNNN